MEAEGSTEVAGMQGVVCICTRQALGSEGICTGSRDTVVVRRFSWDSTSWAARARTWCWVEVPHIRSAREGRTGEAPSRKDEAVACRLRSRRERKKRCPEPERPTLQLPCFPQPYLCHGSHRDPTFITFQRCREIRYIINTGRRAHRQGFCDDRPILFHVVSRIG
jgi:hypothetical protein